MKPMKTLLPIDELNTLREYLTLAFMSGEKPTAEEITDDVLDILILSYVYGTNRIGGDFDENISPDRDKMFNSIYRKTADKNFEERIREYVSSGTVNDILLVADTEAHRVYNEGSHNAALSVGAKTKIWNTQVDDKVRDLHIPLENIKLPINDEFVTWDGDSGLFPGGFKRAENNCNCRCYLTYSR